MFCDQARSSKPAAGIERKAGDGDALDVLIDAC
jgi:hypothetical protein